MKPLKSAVEMSGFESKHTAFRVFFCLALTSALAGCAGATVSDHPQALVSQQLQKTITQAFNWDQAMVDENLKKLAESTAGPCNPVPDSGKHQFIIGYGSLMQDESRKRSAPNAGAAYPVRLKGYRRGWFARGGGVGFHTTYLGVVPDKAGRFNAVIYKLNADEIPAMDTRESLYCRLPVEPSTYDLLVQDRPLPQGQVWIYVNKPESIATANETYPIVQSYVDIFVSGCQEQEERYALKDFSAECLTTTSAWSSTWVNDRLYPRRPFIYQPRAGQIDNLLMRELPDYFHQIRIESAE